MGTNTENEPADGGAPDSGEVPDKQLHRWKGEGGALPPEPDDEDTDPPAGAAAT